MPMLNSMLLVSIKIASSKKSCRRVLPFLFGVYRPLHLTWVCFFYLPCSQATAVPVHVGTVCSSAEFLSIGKSTVPRLKYEYCNDKILVKNED
jgi:hypothetical protein